MQTKNNRGIRRHHRARVIQHAFDMYWYAWGENYRAYEHRFSGYEKVLLENQADVFQHQDEHRAEALAWAKQTADNLKVCSCYMCSWKEHEKSIKEVREAYKDLDDIAFLFTQEEGLEAGGE